MAEIASSIVGGFIADLSSEAVKASLPKFKSLQSVEDEIQRLEDTMSAINAVLLDAEDLQATNNQVKDWLKKLKDVMYDADDLLDEFTTEIKRQRLRVRSNFKAKVRAIFARHGQFKYGRQMGQKVEAIRKRLDGMREDKEQFHLEVGKRQAETKKSGPSGSAKPEIFVGREDDQNKLIGLLLQSDNNKRITTIALVGLGGMGKTALAQQVFYNDNVRASFELKIWVCISENFDVEMISEEIFKSIHGKEPKEDEQDSLFYNLNNRMDGKKFLLVLDDVWNESREEWSRLMGFLRSGAHGSKILLTTRGDNVAKVSSAISLPLKGLSEEESWSLFQQVAFDEEEELRNQNLVTIGKRIAQKCWGLPLVIRSIGSLLYNEDSQSKWQEFEEHEISRIDQEASDKVMSTLLLSYNHLPSHLKSCFAFCCLFPKDSWIDVKTLVGIWMAQGFIQSSDKRRCLGDVGLEYFMDLVHRSFFQEKQEDEGGNVVICKMHDLMHDLATHVAGQECKIVNSGEHNITRETRHVSLVNQLSRLEIFIQSDVSRTLRTFLRPSSSQYPPLQKNLRDVKANLMEFSSKFKCLRVLDLKDMGITHVPTFLSKLKHLRYLDLSGNYFRFIPNSLTKVVNLQALKLNRCEDLKRLPKNMTRLVDLRHLEIEGCYSLSYMPRGLGQLRCLETLSHFVVCHKKLFKNYGCLRELQELKLSGKLTIRDLGHGKRDKLDFKEVNWKAKEGLQQLCLDWVGVKSDKPEDICDEEMVDSLQSLPNLKGLAIKYYSDVKFPEQMVKDMPNLVTVDLYSCRCKQLPLMEILPHLKLLRLGSLKEVEYIDEGTNARSRNAPFFPSLEKLMLWNLPKLKGWWREEVADQNMPFFPRLSSFYIYDCKNLRSIPPQPHLNKLIIEGANTEIVKNELTIANILKTQTETALSSSAASSLGAPLSKLEELRISDIEDAEALPEQCFQNLTSLKQLRIYLFMKLKSIPDLRALTSLNDLAIWHCPSLKSLPHGIQNLSFLSIWSCGFPLDVMDGVMPLKTLRWLFIKGMGDVSLPSSLLNVTTLQTLRIDQMPNLKSLPALPSSLQSLIVTGCPKLGQRVRKSEGEDWPKISHIPFIEFQGRIIQEEKRH